jgi:polyisoprenoid-binding protein YceI
VIVFKNYLHLHVLTNKLKTSKMKKSILLGASALAFLFTACGGAETTPEVTDTDTTVAVVEPVVMNFVVDTASTVVNWGNFSEGELDHQGTVSALNGTAEVTMTGDDAVITGASLVIDMNSISEGSEKLEGHLMSPDFFALETYPTASFNFDRHENGTIYGTVNVIGKELAIEAPAEVVVEGENLTVTIGAFQADFSALEMPFFVKEKAEKPVEEHHNASIQFSGTVKAIAAQ